LKNRIPLIIALIVGIASMVFSYQSLNNQIESATTTVEIVVTKNSIEAYSVIDSSNLTLKSVPPSIVDDNTVLDPSLIANKICTSPIYADKPIDVRIIAEKSEDTGNKQIVGVYIDAARCAGVTEGDIVDVYRIGETFQGEAAPRIAANCRVVRIANDKGVVVKSTVLSGVSGSVGLNTPPQIVYLLVNPAEVPYVISGASNETKSRIALSKKSKETIDIAGGVE